MMNQPSLKANLELINGEIPDIELLRILNSEEEIGRTRFSLRGLPHNRVVRNDQTETDPQILTTFTVTNNQ
ncbi:hypothetical protein, partial [Gloeocapsa sp. PCC 73106]|uniref:hypothetical protein n=1 Tax=Gloeocapsa sp. PCC 73106 TaxID=102232 RepID=UPI0002AC0075